MNIYPNYNSALKYLSWKTPLWTAIIIVQILRILTSPYHAYASVPEETIPPYHWLNRTAIYLTDAGIMDLDLTARPFTRGQIARSLSMVDSKTGNHPRYAIELLERLERELSSELAELKADIQSTEKETHRWYWHSGGYMTADIRYTQTEDIEVDMEGISKIGLRVWPGLYFYNGVRIDSYLPDDKTYKGKYQYGFGGYPEQAYMTLNYKRVSGWLGSNWVRFGPGRGGSLLISDASRPFDGIQLNLELDPFIYRWGAFELDSWGGLRRHLSVHRVELALSRKLEIALSEMILYTGRHLSPLLRLYNPAAIWQLEKFAKTSGNVLLSADVSWRILPKLFIGAELLVDRIKIENDTPNDLEPSEIGGLLNIIWSDPVGLTGSRWTFESVFITQRTYKTSADGQKSLNYERPIGWRGNNDVIEWYYCWEHMPIGDLLVGLDITYELKGEDRIETAFDTTFRSHTLEEGFREPFPTGTVMRSLRPGLNVTWQRRDWLEFIFRLEHFNIENVGHESDVSDDGWTVRVGAAMNIDLTGSRESHRVE